jgi:hypothetical protein
LARLLSPLALPASSRYPSTGPRNEGVHVNVTVVPNTCAARLLGADGTAPVVTTATTIATNVANERRVARPEMVVVIVVETRV